MQQERRAGSETSVLLASTFTGMLHSVGERVQGTQPGSERAGRSGEAGGDGRKVEDR